MQATNLTYKKVSEFKYTIWDVFFVLTAVIDKQNSDIKKVSEFKYKVWEVCTYCSHW